MRKGGTVSWADFPQLAPEKCSEHQRKDQHKTALVLPSSTCTTPQSALAHQKWPARTGGATSPPVADDCVCQSPKNSQPARPAYEYGPSASTTTLSAGRRFLIRSAMQAAVSSSQTMDVVVRMKAQRRDCQRWSHADRPQFTVGVL